MATPVLKYHLRPMYKPLYHFQNAFNLVAHHCTPCMIFFRIIICWLVENTMPLSCRLLSEAHRACVLLIVWHKLQRYSYPRGARYNVWLAFCKITYLICYPDKSVDIICNFFYVVGMKPRYFWVFLKPRKLFAHVPARV